jgi:hypothetical protein
MLLFIIKIFFNENIYFSIKIKYTLSSLGYFVSLGEDEN